MSKSNNKAINEIKEILGDHVASGKPCLKMVSCGEIMINELPFSFSMQNIGAASDAGICVTISGEAVNSGIVRFTDFTFIKNVNGKAIPERYDLPLVKKSDGKMIYQVKFTDIKLSEYDPSTVSTKEDFLNALSAQLTFRVTPLYGGNGLPEIMLSVYPFGDPLTGSATEWKRVTADQDYFLHNLKKGRRTSVFKKRR
ncbi:hypothetical protein [Ruminococcus albus]|uniref:Uncharacterized protein n=1 Tax=Ruminococcus albus SY3 TaxID=1341156 RepID=A0A011UWK9_RUMAL|nr:hypothetical protein [Ruminococcus albus]EXM37557.1 hypothetical protein RASY3_13510 [Ruminococcus albus SY3]